jgi:hypothetical protein
MPRRRRPFLELPTASLTSPASTAQEVAAVALAAQPQARLLQDQC